LPAELRCVQATAKGAQCRLPVVRGTNTCKTHRRSLGKKSKKIKVFGRKLLGIKPSNGTAKPLEPKDYKRYIKSSAWRTKSNAAKKRAGYRCQFCNRHQREVLLHSHHRTYERLGREYQNDLTVFCEDCHNILEKHSRHKPSKVKR
jgi:5-methylcytosine-specific restriction endonuclease McrA